ncbi:hypothetical protein J7413_14365 [Shimia sp. R10_1]|uniref:hypothetical protein n=1 Tax=Shimia sp. R10_1 TaxID=2821095 RepID=UPI001ADBEBDC|nr:hypothetical protein [Shimia sp. R10_1]MBO9474730.1 hypothetical protein [Shimia sp. R10_1]
MIPIMCIVQDGQIPAQTETQLKTQIAEFAQRAFSAPAEIDWIVVPEGSGFTAAVPSTSIVASLHANRALPQDERISLLNELTEICTTLTGRSAHEVVTSIRNPKD